MASTSSSPRKTIPTNRPAKSGRSFMHTLMGVQCLGLGSFVPETMVDNDDLASRGYDAEWILQRSGIQRRRWVAKNESTGDMALQAARRCIDNSGTDPDLIDMIIVGTFTPDMKTPSTACLLQRELGLTAAAMDLNAACSGFIYSMATGAQFIKTGAARHVLVLGAESTSTIVNPEDKQTFPLFGDAAGAMLLGPAGDDQGMLAYTLGSEGNADILHIPVGGSREPITVEAIQAGRHFLHMDGRNVFKWAVRLLPETIADALDHAGVSAEDVDLFFLHQANIRILDAAVANLNVPMEKIVVNLDEYGNTSAASIPLALDQIHRSGCIHRGDRIMLCGFGAGLTWGTVLMQW